MIRSIALFLTALFLIIAIGCGGGGGTTTTGGAVDVLGRVLNVETGGATNPQSSVQIGSNSALTSVADGSFTVPATLGASSLSVDTQSGFGTWMFSFSPITGTTDVGDLWVGPQRVTVRGFIRDSSTNIGIAGATATFGGRIDVTDANGEFVLVDVAYSDANQTAFWGIAGFARANGFVASEWSAQPNVAVAGVVTVNDILLTPNSDPIPPGPPFNIWGRVSPGADAPGTIATLRLNGNPVRVFNVASDGVYRFWVEPGTYTITFVMGSLNASVPSFTLNDPSEVKRFDVTLQ